MERPDGSIAAGQSKFGGYMIFRGLEIILAFSVAAATLVAQQANSQAIYQLKATPKTVAWGYYDAKATTLSVRKWNQNAA